MKAPWGFNDPFGAFLIEKKEIKLPIILRIRKDG
jgi:hypothetical protein